MYMVRIGPIAHQGCEDDTVSEFVSANFDGSEELQSRHGLVWRREQVL